MITTQTFQEYEQLIVSSRQTLPATPYPAKHVHCAFDDLKSAVRAVQALRAEPVGTPAKGKVTPEECIGEPGPGCGSNWSIPNTR